MEIYYRKKNACNISYKLVLLSSDIAVMPDLVLEFMFCVPLAQCHGKAVFCKYSIISEQIYFFVCCN